MELNPELTAVYAPVAMPQIRRLLSQLDREAHSASYGSFDRSHWGWKFRDFPLGMLQTAVYPLALVWRYPFPHNPYYRSPRLLEWITDAIERTVDRQHANGSFDAFAPYEQDPGPTLGMLHGQAEAFRLVQDAVPSERRERFLTALRRGCDFALKRCETHGFVSNHWGLFAVAFLDAYELLGDKKYFSRSEEMLEHIFRNQSPEGWYLEYEGGDPGYESLGIFHLAVYWRRTGSTRLLESLRRSVEFYAHCVHPDGSVGGVYGSRHTGLYFPGGFEILREEIPMAAAIASFMRKRMQRQNVLTPAMSDAENLAPAIYTWLEACFGPHYTFALPSLPCEVLNTTTRFPHSGIIVIGSPHYFGVFNAHKGGVCRIFDKTHERLLYEDSGYLIKTTTGTYTSQIIGLGHLESVSTSEISLRTSFARTLQVVPTPATFLFLRLLNLTVFRNITLGKWVRNIIVKRLILSKHAGPFRLHRSIQLERDQITFRDMLEMTEPATVVQVALPRSFTGIHVGSSKYFLSSELQSIAEPLTETLTTDLNRHRHATCEFTVLVERNTMMHPEVASTILPGGPLP